MDWMPLSLQLVDAADQVGEFNEWVERYHYLGHKHLIGSNLRHFIVDGQDRKLGCFLFQYALKALPRRDEWSGSGCIKNNVPIVPMRANRTGRAANGFVNEINLRYLRTGSNKLKNQ